jgi:hypothetical protein
MEINENILFVLALLSEKLNFDPVHRFLLKIWIHHLSPKQFWGIQSRLGLWICREAQSPCSAAFSNVTEGDPIAFDGAWDHRRNGSKLIGALENTRREKIIH